MAYDPEGNPAILHQDVHFVYLQGDDKERADAEFSWRRDGWQHEAIDCGFGAGEHGEVIFDAQGRPVVFYVNPVSEGDRFGVYAARRDDDGTWETIRTHTGSTIGSVSAALDPVNDEPVAAFYSGPDYGAKVQRLKVDDDFANPDSHFDFPVGSCFIPYPPMRRIKALC